MYILSISEIDTENVLIVIPRIKSYSSGEGAVLMYVQIIPFNLLFQ